MKVRCLFHKKLQLCLVMLLGVSLTLGTSTIALGNSAGIYGIEEVQLLKGDIHGMSVNNLSRVSVTDPGVADISSATKDEILILAKSPGQTVLFLWDDAGKRTIVVRVVNEDLSIVSSRIDKLLNKASIHSVRLEESVYEGKVILTGVLPEKQKEELDEIVSGFSKKIINLVKTEEIEDLIQIDMQITELSTTLAKELGIKWGSAANTTEPTVRYSETIPNLDGSVADYFKVGDFRRTDQLLATVDALVQEGRASILSKPRLVVKNGKEASFLVGGEIPIRSTTRNSTGDTIQEDTEFKEYGVSLTMTPNVKKGKIDIEVNIEISDIDNANSTTTDVAFTTREASTQLLMEDGQTIVLAGLIKKTESESVQSVPVLGKVPILGALFRHRSTPTANQDSEVVISITPHLLTNTNRTSAEETMVQNSPVVVDADIQPPSGDLPLISKNIVEKMKQGGYGQGTMIPAEMNNYVTSVQRQISESIAYPYEAQKNGWQGTVKLTMSILRNGTLNDLVIKETSGYAVFDQDALHTAQILSPYPSFPTDLDLEEVVITVPIVYSLNSFLQNVVKRQ